MNDYTSINGKIVSSKNAVISVQDRGFRFGDGVFETCLIKNGSIYNFDAHFARLEAGLKAIKISSSGAVTISSSYNFHNNICHSRKSGNPESSNKNWIPDQVGDDKKPQIGHDKLRELCQKLIQKNKIKDGILRIAISRGVGSLGYLPSKDAKPTLVIETLEKPQTPKHPIKLMISSYAKPSLKFLPINYKLANGLNSILTKIEANDKNYFDAILLNEKKQICETSAANIFWIKNDVLYTPNLACGCIAGTIREKIIKLSPIKVKLVKAKIIDLLKADEVFITNVTIGVLAIDEIEKIKFLQTKYTKIIFNLLTKDISNS